MCTITLYDDWHFAFYFGLLFILTSCCGLMVFKAGGLEGHFLLLGENGQERIGQLLVKLNGGENI